jgi:hypothetical protein
MKCASNDFTSHKKDLMGQTAVKVQSFISTMEPGIGVEEGQTGSIVEPS